MVKEVVREFMRKGMFLMGVKIIMPFGLMFSLGIFTFQLFYLKERRSMLQVIEQFHNAQINNDKKTMANLLTDDFIETGTRRFVQTPEAIYKNTLVNFDYSKAGVNSISTGGIIPLNVFNTDVYSLSFIRENAYSPENEKNFSITYYVTYTFEDRADGLKIKRINRNL